MQKSYKAPNINSKKVDKSNYVYHDIFIEHISIMLFKPILSALKERKQSKQSFINEMNESGLKYTYYGFIQSARGKNKYCRNYNYISRIYEYLELPFPSLEYLNKFD